MYSEEESRNGRIQRTTNWFQGSLCSTMAKEWKDEEALGRRDREEGKVVARQYNLGCTSCLEISGECPVYLFPRKHASTQSTQEEGKWIQWVERSFGQQYGRSSRRGICHLPPAKLTRSRLRRACPPMCAPAQRRPIRPHSQWWFSMVTQLTLCAAQPISTHSVNRQGCTSDCEKNNMRDRRATSAGCVSPHIS